MMSDSNSSDNCICYGPIRFYARKGKAPTLSTGRKSKDEELHGEELRQREFRREKNRLLAKRLKEKRENIQNKLIEQVKKLDNEHSHLLNHIEQLNSYKINLLNQIEQLKDDSLINLIHQEEIPLFFQQFDNQDFINDSLMSIFSDEQSSIDDLFSSDSY